MIPLVGSPAKPPNYGELVTGDSSRFMATNGSWVNSGGTLSWDSTSLYKWGASGGSLKLIATTNGQYVELPIAGTFLAGKTYLCMFAVTLEGNSSVNPAIDFTFGLIGTDESAYTTGLALMADQSGTEGRYINLAIRWTPSANRTGVKVRITARNAETLHVGQCRVFRLPDDRRAVSLELQDESASWTFGYLPILEPSLGATRFGPGSDGGLYFGKFGPDIENDWGSGVFSFVSANEDGVYIQAETNIAPGDLAGAGMNVEVGTDYVGFYVNELDSGTVQFYADDAAGYMMQLRHRGSGMGWAVSPDGTENVRMEAYFDWVFTKAGTLAVNTDVALPYYRTPFKCKITEVQAHVGTAPTGAALIIDVNDDGTTIFTTQGNRPQVADGTNDDTSGAPDGGTAVAAGSVITVDVDQIGSGTAGADLTVQVRGYFIW